MSWERWRGFAVLGVLWAAVSVAGCDSSSGGDDDDDDDDDDSSGDTSLLGRCKAICDDIQDANCSTTFDHATCVSGCSDSADATSVSNCNSQYDTYLDCIDALTGDTCDLLSPSVDPCDSDLQPVLMCLSDYCTAHPSTTYCN